MVPSNVILDRLAVLLSADATTLAPAADANHVHLIIEAFTPGPTTDFTALDAATFTGSTAKNAGVGAQQSFTDPVTGRRIVQLLEPVGGWHWQATDAVNLPQTVYGFVVTDNDDLITYGSGLFATPIVLLASGNGVDIAQVRFEFVPPVLA